MLNALKEIRRHGIIEFENDIKKDGYEKVVSLMNNAIYDADKEVFDLKEPFWISIHINIKYDWKDKLRILFGKTAHCDSRISVSKLVEIVEETKTHAYVDSIIPKKIKGVIEQPNPKTNE